MQAEGRISELVLLDGQSSARISCPGGLIPAPGQYVLAHADGSDAPLASVLLAARVLQDGFITATPIHSTWIPGMRLHLRGPLGHGFRLPAGARRIGLIAFKCSPTVLLSLLGPASRQDASVTLVAEHIPEDLPLQVEAQPLHALLDVYRWADFGAFDTPREFLPELREMLQAHRSAIKAEGQILIRVPMPCGALAGCGVCTVEFRGDALLACEDGPVFDLGQAMEWSSRA
jgi:NAD(P)H-flavin reductase